MSRVVASTLIFAAVAIAVAAPAGAGKPQPTPTPEYHFRDLALRAGGKGAGLKSLSDDGLAAGTMSTGVTCKGSPVQRAASVWDVDSHPTAPSPAWVDAVPAGCKYCYSEMEALSADGTWGAGEVCDPENGSGCGCSEVVPMLWERDWSSPTLSFVRVELGDPQPPNSVSMQSVAEVAGQRVAITTRFGGLFREVGGVWTHEDYSGDGQRFSINGEGIVAGYYWDGAINRSAAWDCTIQGCSADPVYLPSPSSTAQRYQINDWGDILGGSKLWRRAGTMTWDEPEVLRVEPFSGCIARASERLDSGTLVVVGACNQVAVRWTSTGPGQWTGPTKIETLDDASGQILDSTDVNPSGQILGHWSTTYRGCVETPLQ